MKKTILLILILIFAGLIFCALLAPEWFAERKWLWLVIGYVAIRAVLLVRPKLLGRSFIEFDDDCVVLNGMVFDCDNIRSARVFSVRMNGKMGRYLEVGFKKNPRLPFWFRVKRFFADSAFPFRCADGIPLTRNPRVILPMGDTPLSDETIEKELTKRIEAAPNP